MTTTLRNLRATMRQTSEDMGPMGVLRLRHHYSIEDCWDGYVPRMVFNKDGTVRFERDEDEIMFRLKYL